MTGVCRSSIPCIAALPDQEAVACAFDLLMRDSDDLLRRPLIERKTALGKLLIRSRGGIQYVEQLEKIFVVAERLK